MTSRTGLPTNITNSKFSIKKKPTDFLRIRLTWFENGFTVVALLLLSGALVPLISGVFSTTDSYVSGNPLMQAIYSGIYALTGFLLLIRWKLTIHTAKRDKFIWVLISLALLSVFWSFSPMVTLRRGIALVGTSIFGVYFASRYNIEKQLNILAWTFGLIIILSFIVAIFFPDIGIMGGKHLSAWQGVFRHKNLLGRLMALSTIIFFLISINRKKKRWSTWILFAASIVLVILSQSITAIIIFLCIATIYPILRITQKSYKQSITLYFVLVPLIISLSLILFLNFEFTLTILENILNYFGRDLTLSGRTYLWLIVSGMILQRPLLGYGYGAFWLGWEGESAKIWNLISWLPPHAHNGFLDLLLDLGFMGLFIFTIGYFISIKKAVKFINFENSPLGLWPLYYLIFFMLSTIPESVILQQNDIYWVLFVTILLSISTNPRKITLFHKKYEDK